MNKTTIKNFAIWARNKLIADITYKAGLLGIFEKEIKNALPQSTKDVQFFNIGTREPYAISGIEIHQREKLVEEINNKAKQSDYKTAYKAVIEEVAYTWFNRLIAVRFMEVNDYLPARMRVLSSESPGKTEPDLVTKPFEAALDFSPYEKDRIVQMTHDNQMDELFRTLFIKQCNALNGILPNLFEKTNDFTELLLNVSFTDKDGVVYHLVNDIPENDFRVRTAADEAEIAQGKLTEEDAPSGQVEIIGWLYQYYNTEPKDETFALLKKNVKISKERIPAATQLFTPDWIVRYMVENSLGRLWIERSKVETGINDGHMNASNLGWKYYLEEVEQEPEVEAELEKIREEYKSLKPEDIKVIDPCMGSGHILVYAFDVLMQIYESYGYSRTDAAKSILLHNIYGLDIDNRAYQLAYFAIMMKARQYNRRILNEGIDCHVYSIQESNDVNRNHLKYFGSDMDEMERNAALLQIQGLLDTFIDAKEYGSILNVENYNWELLYRFAGDVDMSGQLTMETMGIEKTKEQLSTLIEIGAVMAQKYDVVVTNPPYMSNKGMSLKLLEYVQQYYEVAKVDMFAVFMIKSLIFAKANRFQALITQHAWMFLSSLEDLRIQVLQYDIINMIHLGARAFEEIAGEVVQTTAFVLRNSSVKNYISTYCRLVIYGSQREKQQAFLSKYSMFYSTKQSYSIIPGTPMAYWISDKAKNIYNHANKFNNVTITRAGMITGNNDIFVRLWHEVDKTKSLYTCTSRDSAISSNATWFPYSKGGEFRRWYGNNDCVVNWFNDGSFMRKFKDKSGKIRAHAFNLEFIFKENLCWNSLSSYKFSARYTKEGFLYDAGGSFASVLNKSETMYYLGFLNSIVAFYYLSALNPTMNFQKGNVGDLPVIQGIQEKTGKVRYVVENSINLSKCDWDSYESSWDFARHPLRSNTTTIAEAFDQWKQFAESQFKQLKFNEEELNRIFIDIYGLQDELTPEVDDKDVTIRTADLGRDIRSFISYAIGCMFGRYSLDVDGLAYAGGLWDDSKYNTFIPDKDNILPITDEEYFKDDVVGLFIVFVKKVYGEETLEENLNFIANALGNKGNTSREIIRNYFLNDFFKAHCKVYQKRPIYWLFDSGKANGFKALIYLHRYDENTIGNLRIDYLHKMQRIYESEITRMQDIVDNSTNNREVTSAEKRKEKLIRQLKETKEYDEKIAHLALARTSLDLDDGVKANYEKVQTGTDGERFEVLAKI